MEGNATKDVVRVDVVDVDSSGYRQIAPRERLTVQLTDRRDEIQAAVLLAADIIQSSADAGQTQNGWSIKEIEAKFSLTLAAEAGVILSKASAEAAFEVTITVSKDQ